jgi:hypothetical protein
MIRAGKTRLREAAINALLSADTIEKAANKAGISKRTLLRWMKKPEFRAQYAETKSEALKMASGILARNATKAALVLAEIFSLKKGRQNQAARVTAAMGCIRLAHESFELEDLEQRIRKLEQKGEQQGDSF